MNKEQAVAKARKLGLKWVAMDADGGWYGYRSSPGAGYERWHVCDGARFLGRFTVDWKKTLTEVGE